LQSFCTAPGVQGGIAVVVGPARGYPGEGAAVPLACASNEAGVASGRPSPIPRRVCEEESALNLAGGTRVGRRWNWLVPNSAISCSKISIPALSWETLHASSLAAWSGLSNSLPRSAFDALPIGALCLNPGAAWSARIARRTAFGSDTFEPELVAVVELSTD
jgi:hypothetical protein